jgi:hypothetical protein
VGEHAQAVEQADAQHRREHRAGQPEHDQERGEVAQQQVLDHVRVQPFLTGHAQRGEREEDHHEPGVEARHAPARGRVPGGGERMHAPRVQGPDGRQRR